MNGAISLAASDYGSLCRNREVSREDLTTIADWRMDEAEVFLASRRRRDWPEPLIIRKPDAILRYKMACRWAA